jgi:hypothetical protein
MSSASNTTESCNVNVGSESKNLWCAERMSANPFAAPASRACCCVGFVGLVPRVLPCADALRLPIRCGAVSACSSD